MALDNDPMGGIDKISAAVAQHMGQGDNIDLKRIFENYMTGAKGADGTPNGERWLEESHARLASEEAIRGWVELSEGAVEKFMDDFFLRTWSRWDQYKTGHIDTTDVVPFFRELAQSMSPGVSMEENPY